MRRIHAYRTETMAQTGATALSEGYLMLHSPSCTFHKWQRRWFTLERSDGVLRCFEKHNSNVKSGMISEGSVKVISTAMMRTPAFLHDLPVFLPHPTTAGVCRRSTYGAPQFLL